jgi:hypothetical protein
MLARRQELALSILHDWMAKKHPELVKKNKTPTLP